MATVQPHSGVELQDRYRLDRQLGQGGMATVWLAQDLKQGRPVALKILRPDLAAILGPERFVREIEFTARLTHPNILPLHDSGLISSDTEGQTGLPWYTMPYVEGESLRARLKREKQLPLADALQIAREVADALSYAHGHDVLHRDIKPENILLESGHAVVADFGIAKALSAAANTDRSSGTFPTGTADYMSPELTAGEPTLDGRSDVYALGCVLYEMLAGQPPFTGATAESIACQHLAAPVPSVRVVRPSVPPPVDEAITRALAKVPSDRFGSAQEFAAELALPPRRWSQPVVQRRPRPVVFGLAGAAAVGLALLAWRWLLPARAPPDANRVVVFPVVGPADSAKAASVTEAILTALDGTSVVAGIDGRRLGNGSSERARAAKARAGFYLTATLLASDSLRLRLELHRLRRDTLISRTLAFPNSTTGWELGMHAARAVLPLLLPAAREQDFPLFGTVAPKALAEFFLGEQQYRQAAFEQALGHYRRAVRADSGFGLAALHGAQAATWTSQPDQARALLAVALARPAGLPPRLRGLAEGLDDYLHGRADSAVARFRRVVQVDQENSEAWMLLGETYTHLLPSAGPLDSLAEDAFQRTHRLDSAFTPVLFHLIEAAARRGDTVAGGHALRALRAARPDSIELGSAELMLRCVTRPLMAPDWRQAVLRSPDEVRVAAQSLSVAGLEQQQCARDAWRALVTFDARTPDPTTIRRRFAALLGLQNVLIAEGKDEEVRALWASDTLFNRGFGTQMMVLDALATGRFQPFADSFAAARFRELAAGDTVVSPELWLAGSWAARSGSADAARAAAESLAARARVDRERVDSLLARSLAAQLALARGDSAGALAMLGALKPNAPETNLIAWRPLESLGYERLLLTELLVRRRRFPEALKLAANFDAPAPLVYAVFLPASLSLRREAAEAWGEQAVARRSAKRLQELGQGRVQ